MYQTTIEEFLDSDLASDLAGQVQLIFTSPPFPLQRKKRYGNLNGESYLNWLGSLAKPLARLLKPDGSLVLELGNSWEPGSPAMSTLPLRALLRLQESGDFHLCQSFVAHNPARLPSPTQWVNIERIRVKDSYTNIWWLSPTDRPKADNRNVLVPYSPAMKKLLHRKSYNSGTRPSEHEIGDESFLTDNGGAIPPNVFTISNTRSNDRYRKYCKHLGIRPHPARMQPELVRFFVEFLTDQNDLVLDPFGGSNTTGYEAEALGRRWIAIEPSIEYILGSKGRFTTEQLAETSTTVEA